MTRIDPSEPHGRPSLTPAIVSGSFAVVVALITGAFNWISHPAPSPPGPTLAVGPTSPTPAEPIRTAELDPIGANAPSSRRARADFVHLNFAAFQACVKDPTAGEKVRREAIERCIGQTVIWRGYVDEVVAMPPGTDAQWTVVLCEDEATLGQSAFKTPALCRFDDDAEGRLPSLAPGQRVTITGTCVNHSALGTTLLHCRLTATH